MTSDIWGRVQRASFSPFSHTFEKLVTKILGSYHYFMVFYVVFWIIFSMSHTKGRCGVCLTYLYYFRFTFILLLQLELLYTFQKLLYWLFSLGQGDGNKLSKSKERNETFTVIRMKLITENFS